MPTLQEIHGQLEQLGVNGLIRGTMGTELLGLAQTLMAREPILGVAVGEWQGKKAILAVTAQRVIFANRGAVGGNTLAIALEKIKEVEFTAGMLRGAIMINGARLEKAGLVQAFMDALNQVRAGGAQVAPAGGGDIAGELGRLAALRDTGVLTAEEFAAAKAKVLR